ncbi:hypothetical protein KI688_004190 [Linnemannia hyalina]|uniref:Uncharacterized protein n=1 Tax=Linnemannia hyalina TaxID=64524 RepID=A0A9P8BPM2_9FUNG|nr:hypothetical protein KI688_004190 [Linnemannia hyalina]
MGLDSCLITAQRYGHRRPLSLDNAIRYGNLSPAFTLASFKFLKGVYDVLHEHQEQFQDFLDWVSTVLHKHHPDLAAHLQHELDHNIGECLTTIFPSTDMTIPATSCFTKERWLDQASMDACLDAFYGLFSTNANIFIFTIYISTLVSSDNDSSGWPAFHNCIFDV